MALGEEGFQTLHLVQRENIRAAFDPPDQMLIALIPDCFLIRFTRSARKDCSLISLLAERESRRKGEINGS